MNDIPTPDEVKAAAKAVRLSIVEMCKRAGIHPGTFHRWAKNPNKHGLSTVALQKMINVVRECK
jgi:hypothetical protein